ncbi:MAG TPA: type IV secretion system protein, partial [Candidatus Dormibacteraeota bacterium]|nr:type IV secretion system protein [Candidatus Dormibacteraeota bacterium]
EMRAAEQRDAVLSAQQLAALPPASRAQLQAARSSAALLQGLTHDALANSSSRFASLQQLIDAISRASDQKGILDLQARIGAESGMLQNEHTKLQVLYQGAQAEEWANSQRLHELAIAGHGTFRQRFQPQP